MLARMLRIRSLRRLHLAVPRLDVAAGEAVAVTGPSGSGKSLLLRAVADLDPNEGEVSAAGVDRAAVPAPRWRRLVTYVPADSGWWADTVAEHFTAPDAARPLLRAMRLPEEVLGWEVGRLSTGERQRCALARALVQDPPVLLLDEPTAALDPDAAAAVEALLRARLEAGAAMLMVTHDAAQAARLAARVLRLEGGAVVAGGGEAEAGP
jgi:ABC-type iron transport system FetAB ATPase subunit